MPRPPAPPVTPPPPGHRRLRLTVAYDGGPFRGFAANAGVTTVGGTLADALARFLGAPVELACAGRTDAGVHAWGQVVSFDAPVGVEPAEVQRRLNRLCGPLIAVREVVVVSDEFDARHSARARTYRYTVLNRGVPDPFRRHTAWLVPGRLDRSAMNDAAAAVVGEHNFASFCRKRVVDTPEGPTEASLVRQVLAAGWTEPEPDLLMFEIVASAFCHQMVRAVTGTLVEVGTGRRAPEDVAAVIAARDRAAAGQLAPPHGLCLWHVDYP